MLPSASMNLMGLYMDSHQLFVVITTLAGLPTIWLQDLSLLSYLSAGGVAASVTVVLCLFWVGISDGVGFHRGWTILDVANIPTALGLFTLCTILYAGVAAAGFLMFGKSTKSQFILNLPVEYRSSKIAVWTMVVNPLTKYALTMTYVALRIEELLPPGKQTHSTTMMIRTMLVCSTLIVSLSFPFFGLLWHYLDSYSLCLWHLYYHVHATSVFSKTRIIL